VTSAGDWRQFKAAALKRALADLDDADLKRG
jgi:hypothetical protein